MAETATQDRDGEVTTADAYGVDVDPNEKIPVFMLTGRFRGQEVKQMRHYAENLVETGQARWPILETPEQEPVEETQELANMTRPELEALADKRGIDVQRQDGEDGRPLKSDYLAALTVSG